MPLKKLLGLFKQSPAPPAPDSHASEAERIVALIDKSIDTYWTSNYEATKDFRVEFVRDVAGDFREKALQSLQSSNPLLENRKALTATVMSLAQLQVLVLDKAADSDDSLLANSCISGELKPRLFEIWNADPKLRKLVEPATQLERKDWNAVWNPVLFKYRVTWARANILNGIRILLNDGDASGGKDWFRALFVSQCIACEDDFRETIAMPPLLDEDRFKSRLMGVAISTLFNRVLEGHEHPVIAWRDLLMKDELGRLCLAKAGI
jgi:hypothetical protein